LNCLFKDYISERPQIWNTNSEGFRHSQTRQSAFTEVAQLLSNQQETYTSEYLKYFIWSFNQNQK